MWVSKRPVALGALALLMILAPAGSARAQDTLPTVTVEEGATMSTDTDGEATLSATVTVTGPDGPYALSIDVAGAAEPGACVPLAHPVLTPGVATPVKIKLSSACELADTAGVTFVIYPLGSIEPLTSGPQTWYQVRVDDPSPSWWLLLWGFGGGAVLASIATLIAWLLGPNPSWRYPFKDQEHWPLKMSKELPGLNGKWTFASSQLTSVTAAAALFTGVFGATPVLEKILGDSADGPIAFAVVASAMSALLIGAAPLWLDVTRNEPPKFANPDAPNNFRGSGVLVATATIEAASVGLIISIAAMMWTGSDINQGLIATAGALTALFALVYGARAMRRSLKIGMVESALDEFIRTVKQQAAKGHTEVRKAKRSSNPDGHWVAAATALDAVESDLKKLENGISKMLDSVRTASTATTTAKTAIHDKAADARETVEGAVADVEEAATAVTTGPRVELPDRNANDTSDWVREVRQQLREAALP